MQWKKALLKILSTWHFPTSCRVINHFLLCVISWKRLKSISDVTVTYKTEQNNYKDTSRLFYSKRSATKSIQFLIFSYHKFSSHFLPICIFKKTLCKWIFVVAVGTNRRSICLEETLWGRNIVVGLLYAFVEIFILFVTASSEMLCMRKLTRGFKLLLNPENSRISLSFWCKNYPGRIWILLFQSSIPVFDIFNYFYGISVHRSACKLVNAFITIKSFVRAHKEQKQSFDQKYFHITTKKKLSR